METFIEAKNINLTYNRNKDNAFQALHDVSLKIKKGEFVVIFGPSGCGKSSLMNVIAGLEKPDDGSVTIDGKDLLSMDEEGVVDFHCRKMGMIFQAYNLIPSLNVLDNVSLPQMLNDKKKKERDERSMEFLKRFGIEKQWKKIPTELSGGQQQRIGIARSIINDPQIVLADEPIGNLDTKSANHVMEILGDLNKKEEKTVVLVSHNPENIVWGSHIVHMKDGKIIKEEMKEPDKNIEVESDEQSNKSEFDKVHDKFRGLSEEQIGLMANPLKAKMLMESFLIPYEQKQTDTIEKNIEMYLSKRINGDHLLSNLDKNLDKGGAELDQRTAQRLFNTIERTVFSAEVFAKEKDANKKSLIILDYLRNKFDFKIKDDDRMSKLGNLIKKKITNQINHAQFKSLLDSSANKEGIGLDKRVARKIAREIDVFLIVGYGMKSENDIQSEVEKRKNVQDKDNLRKPPLSN